MEHGQELWTVKRGLSKSTYTGRWLRVWQVGVLAMGFMATHRLPGDHLSEIPWAASFVAFPESWLVMEHSQLFPLSFHPIALFVFIRVGRWYTE